MKSITVDVNGFTNITAGTLLRKHTHHDVYLVAMVSAGLVKAVSISRGNRWSENTVKVCCEDNWCVKEEDIGNLIGSNKDDISILEPHEVAEFFAKKAGGSFASAAAASKVHHTFFLMGGNYVREFVEFYSDGSVSFFRPDGLDTYQPKSGWTVEKCRNDDDIVEIPTGSRTVPPQFVSIGTWVGGNTKAAYRVLEGKNYVIIMKDGSRGNCVNTVKQVMEELARGERKVLTEAEAKALLTPPDAYFVDECNPERLRFLKVVCGRSYVYPGAKGVSEQWEDCFFRINEIRTFMTCFREVSKAEFDRLLKESMTPIKKKQKWHYFEFVSDVKSGNRKVYRRLGTDDSTTKVLCTQCSVEHWKETTARYHSSICASTTREDAENIIGRHITE